MRYDPRFRSLLWLLTVGMLMAFSFAACGPGQVFGPTLTPTPTNTPIPTNTPEPTATPTSTPTPEPTATATLVPTTGKVTGKIVDKDTGRPLEAIHLFMPTVVQSSDGYMLNRKGNDPSTETDASGVFAFADVPPGTYALALTKNWPFSVAADEEGSALILEVVAGETLDVGVIRVEQ